MNKSAKTKNTLLNKSTKNTLPNKSTKTTNTLLVVLIPASATVLVAFLQFVLPHLTAKTPTDVTRLADVTRPFVGRVANESTGKSIDGAKVSLEGKGLPPVIYTDSEGRFSFPITSDLDQIKIRVDAEGYKPFERRINPSAKVEPEDIRLTLANPSPSPVNPVKRPSAKPKKELTLEEKKRRAFELLHSKSSTPNPG